MDGIASDTNITTARILAELLADPTAIQSLAGLALTKQTVSASL